MILKLKISQFQVGSYIHDNTQINFSGKYEQNINSLFLLWTTLIARYEHDVENQRAQQYVLKCVNLGPNDTVIHWANKSFSQTGFQVHFFCFSSLIFFHFCFFVFFFFSMTRSSTEPTRYLLALKYSPQLLARSIQIVREIGLATELIEWNIHKSGGVLFKNFQITLYLW